ncbi:UDP-N-acetylmuramoyl-L-alanyl-D-glutamate--L-lysine ligase,UDP-N-acetylmuramoylalanyl-D-glutamate--2,6-diaminopimelate ligase,Folylpolyglutamate synthase,UDP-N-acetylmuramyl-tripeptide synthetase,Mur ligase middle domain [Chlamydia serpentis]|uniref:UDP-N-acetylmuramoyl-L-alanyl-D-glutamate--2,6-diaminopimelate ligase n=1 Tax=Chlamydia serpentis TaxID=1967782 RepID=A0A2R8FB53_9CHLA|nr:UDP-N-acetylmuramoyl-L-alanyl-D-glutamate--2,6-diaminopimelate ligase [Chlamydia serpentis]SPN73552.1 UDP-N-acetylmuramoyl-L-alanyl-D-glutamate--L-lysine ligase,UDP-N-acetylmuramoylalanyl-D-glutamate--2,6-diaminopimelate ligase,Folylpolyglutamate synthase,UDP-N-acetylmuramyl-tripeptide synthetase,Mur ligase middle domain [Chlamydia serpentis]
MDLKELLQGIQAKIYGKIRPFEVRNLTRDSRCVGVGDVFIAHKGRHYDGNDFAAHAVDNGAIAVLSSLYNPFLPIVQVITPYLDKLEAELSAKYYDYPSNKLYTIGVTGTNGKTTVVSLIKALLDSYQKPCGLLGTIEHILGEGVIKDGFTTPTPALLQKYLATMVRQNREAVAMEVSSIGLALGRVAYTNFDAAVLTNITLDHLDFHGSFETYVEAKAKLFSFIPSSGLAVVNADSPYALPCTENTSAKIVTYGIETRADYQATDIQLSCFETKYTLIHREEKFACSSLFIGKHNVYNMLAAISTVHATLNCDLIELLEKIGHCQPPPGRLDPVLIGRCPIYIDYAHTPDALDNVLTGLSELLPKEGRLIVVFGCGGDRDRSKRKLMAQVVERYGFAIVTSDNPRGESPEDIINEICQGFYSKNYCIKIDRKEAITYALSIASDKDIVLVAGKGHEAYQIFKHQTVAFDDKQTVCEVLASHV